MKPFITIVYHPEENVFRIQYQEKQLDMSRLEQMSISEWGNPFVKNKHRWYGLYEELRQLCGEDDYKVIFDGSDDDLRSIKNVLSEHKIEILTNANKVVIVYNRAVCSIRVTVNGRLMDTSSVEGVPLERTIEAIPMREWKGLFSEIEDYLGHTGYTVSFVGNSEDIRCLVDACPENVDLSYKPSKLNTAKASSTAMTEAVSTSAIAIKETVSATAKPLLDTAKEKMQNGSETMTVGTLTFTKIRVAKILILIGLVCFAFPFLTVSCNMINYEEQNYSGFQIITASSVNHLLASQGSDIKIPGNIFLLLAFLAGVLAFLFLILRKIIHHLPGKLRNVIRRPASIPHRVGGILSTVSAAFLLIFRLTIKTYYPLDESQWSVLMIETKFGFVLCLIVMAAAAVLCLTAKEDPIEEDLLDDYT